MTIEEAIIKVIGKDSYNRMNEGGVSNYSILENACLTAFLSPLPVDGEKTLRVALGSVWNKTPGPIDFKLNIV